MVFALQVVILPIYAYCVIAVLVDVTDVLHKVVSPKPLPVFCLLNLMHQSIPPAPNPPPPGNCGAFARLVSPGGGVFANFALPGRRAFANPRAIPELLTRTRFPIRI